MDESDLIKLQKCYEEFEENPNQQLAATIELKCDMLKVALGDRFYDLRHFLRISNAISQYLDNLNPPNIDEFEVEDTNLSKLFGEQQ